MALIGGVVAFAVTRSSGNTDDPPKQNAFAGTTTSSTTTTPPDSGVDGPLPVVLADLVVQPGEVPDGYVPAAVGLVGSSRPTICNVYPLSDSIVDEAGTEYTDPVLGVDLASEVIQFTDDADAAAWMSLFEGLPDQCVTWDFLNPDGSVSTWDSQLRVPGDPYNNSEISIVARTDFGYGCIVNAYAKAAYVVRTTICGTAPLDDTTLDTLSNLTGDRLP